MRGAILPLPHTSSWRGAQLNTGTTLPLLYLSVSLVMKLMVKVMELV